MVNSVARAACFPEPVLLRMAAMAFLRCNPEETFGGDVPLRQMTDKPFDDAMRDMCWASQPTMGTLMALSHILRRPIIVLQDEGPRWVLIHPNGSDMCMSPWNPDEPCSDHIMVWFSREHCHYDALVPTPEVDEFRPPNPVITLRTIFAYLTQATLRARTTRTLNTLVGLYHLTEADRDAASLTVSESACIPRTL